jgi:hypothetical protein
LLKEIGDRVQNEISLMSKEVKATRSFDDEGVEAGMPVEDDELLV